MLAVKNLLDLGLIRHWALSNENAYGLTMFCLACDRLGVPRPVCVQNDMSLNNRVYEGDVAEAAHQFGVVGLPYGALSGGVLTGKYLDRALQSDDGRPLEASRMRVQPKFQPRYASPVSLAATAEYVGLASKHGLKPLELALAWARDRWYNGGVIPGFTTIAQVEANPNPNPNPNPTVTLTRTRTLTLTLHYHRPGRSLRRGIQARAAPCVAQR